MSRLASSPPPRPRAGRLPRLLRGRARLVPALLALGALALPFARALQPLAPAQEEPSGSYLQALAGARAALDAQQLPKAREWIERALERDPRSVEAWRLRARWAKAAADADEEVYALHQALRHARAQGLPKPAQEELRAAVLAADPVAQDLYALDVAFAKKLGDLAARYEKEARPHAAIGVLKTVLALDPTNAGAQESIERIAARPDPSLAADAKPKDLFADVSREWIEEHDRAHATWETRATLERDNYVTHTDAGYEVLVRAAEAMEQMNAFYRRFFRYGGPEDGRSVPRIALHIFKDREEYLALGKGPPVDWSAGHFTGDSVETFLSGGFDSMTGTLFHEAAHQFVSLATSAAGWLNEGLASFFEGTRILPNGTVLMNLPANHRLFPLAARLEQGWMSGPDDGIGPDGKGDPVRAPTFRTVLENRYAWGPPWYAPTWGVVYFLYNYQDPVDGRFVYRKSFGDFVDASGGREGEGAVENFEQVVLGNPMPEIRGFERPDGAVAVALPKTVAELDPVWKAWLLELRDEQQGKLERVRPYLAWGRAAVLAGDLEAAQEHFEKGLVAAPHDVELRLEFAALLAGAPKNPDRAAKLVQAALGVLEAAKPPDAKRIAEVERLLAKYDPKRDTLASLRRELAAAARGLVERYQAAERPSMVMDLAWRFGTDLGATELFAFYERAARTSGKSLRIWELAYDEQGLTGWTGGGAGAPFTPNGIFLDARFGEFDPEVFDYQALTLDRTSSGDFSMEADVQAERGQVTFAGFVFGRKDPSSFHGLFFFPGKAEQQGLAAPGYVDLLSSFGAGQPKTWRHIQVETRAPVAGASTAGSWHRLRVDVSGRFVDLWFDGVLLATQEFPSHDVLRGGFGLMVGRGAARFKNVRYLASDPRDPVAGIERELRIAKLGGKSQRESKSFLGLVPPWPKVARWVQGARSSWEEAGPVPQLLVFLSQAQNDAIRIDQWLTAFAQDAEPYGLQVVVVASPNDARTLGDYLKTHPLPGAVAIDFRGADQTGIGDTFEAFHLRRFNLPRILLLDVDHRVAWEGDPGVTAGKPWQRGDGSFVDAPLEDLVARRKLDRLPAFRKAWREVALPALAEGRLEPALETLRAARELEGEFWPEVALAQRRLAQLEAAVRRVAPTAQELAARGGDPAIPVLVEWQALCGEEPPPRLAKDLKPLLESKASKDWALAGKACTRWRNLMARKEPDAPAAASELIATLRGLSGALPRELADELQASQDAGDAAAFEALVAGVAARPQRWLARAHFGWGAPEGSAGR